MSAVETRSKNSNEDSSVANPAVASLRKRSRSHVDADPCKQKRVAPSASGATQNPCVAGVAITTLEECATWLLSLGEHDTDEPIRRLSAALRALQAKPARSSRAVIQSMLKSWNVPQKHAGGTKFAASEINSMFQTKVLEEARRLKVLCDSHSSSSAIMVTLAKTGQGAV